MDVFVAFNNFGAQVFIVMCDDEVFVLPEFFKHFFMFSVQFTCWYWFVGSLHGLEFLGEFS